MEAPLRFSASKLGWGWSSLSRLSESNSKIVRIGASGVVEAFKSRMKIASSARARQGSAVERATS